MSADSTAPKIVYKPIKGFEGFWIGTDTTVWTLWRRVSAGFNKGSKMILGEIPKPVKHRTNKDGYKYVSLWRNGKPTNRRISRLMLAAFVGPCPPGMEACHNNGIRADNSLGNLRWDTRSGNHADKKRHGTWQGGEANGNARLTAAQVLEIRNRAATGEERQRDIAKDYGVTQCLVGKIHRREMWTHV